MGHDTIHVTVAAEGLTRPTRYDVVWVKRWRQDGVLCYLLVPHMASVVLRVGFKGDSSLFVTVGLTLDFPTVTYSLSDPAMGSEEPFQVQHWGPEEPGDGSRR